MANIATTQPTPSPMLARVHALLALLAHYLGDATRTADFNRVCDEVERLLARCMFEAAARLAGRPDLLHTHEAILVWKGASFQIRVQQKACAYPPLYRAYLKQRHNRVIRRYRTILGVRSRRSAKISTIRARNQRRRPATLFQPTNNRVATHASARTPAPP